jgi:hypothetical protein
MRSCLDHLALDAGLREITRDTRRVWLRELVSSDGRVPAPGHPVPCDGSHGVRWDSLP